MSGTSLDGIDAVLVGFDKAGTQLKHSLYQHYDDALRKRLLALHEPCHDDLAQASLLGIELAKRYAQAVNELLAESDIAPEQVRAIGCHGQTVRHRPELGYTIQLNNPALLAERTGICVVADFRSRDIAAGGQGAPLVPAFHAALFSHPQQHRVIVNIGGISNLTDLPPNSAVGGFDCGPGNMLMDAWISRHLGKAYDIDGAWAASGRVIPSLLEKCLALPFFKLAPPKSTGREAFNLAWLESLLNGNEPSQDVQATLLMLTAHGIADAIKNYCSGTSEVYCCGGGARNHALMEALGKLLPGCAVGTAEALGVKVDLVEAFAFAWLAHQTIHGAAGNLPAVTGAGHACVLGAIYPA